MRKKAWGSEIANVLEYAVGILAVAILAAAAGLVGYVANRTPATVLHKERIVTSHTEKRDIRKALDILKEDALGYGLLTEKSAMENLTVRCAPPGKTFIYRERWDKGRQYSCVASRVHEARDVGSSTRVITLEVCSLAYPEICLTAQYPPDA